MALLTPVALGAVASSANGSVVGVNWTVLVGNQANHKAIQGERFLPGDITIDQNDSVTWKANGAEIHTVTFFAGGTAAGLPDPLDPTDRDPGDPQGGATMGPGDFNSGLLTTMDAFSPIPVPVFHSVHAHLPATPGTYTYYCLVHGVMMRGVVHVQPAGTDVPRSQDDIDADAAFQAGAITAEGRAQWAQLKAASTPHKVFMGYDNGRSTLMRFVHKRS